MEQPPFGLTFKAKVENDAYDGDTVEVVITHKLKIRITNDERNFDTPEKGWRAKDDAEREWAERACKFANNLIRGKELVVHIPTDGSIKLGDVLSFERVVGFVFVDGKDLAVIMDDNGFSKRTDFKGVKGKKKVKKSTAKNNKQE